MVSFCDIPISQASENMSKYGNYAIGLTEEWAIAQGLTPVIYLQRDSFLADSLLKVLNFFTSLSSEKAINEIKEYFKAKNLPFTSDNFIKATICGTSNSNEDDLMASLDILRYTKNYFGELRRANGHCEPKYYFAEEREWRYALNTEHFSKFIYPDEVFKNKMLANLIQQRVANERLEFTPSDICYILIAKEEDRTEMEAHLRSLNKKYNDIEIEELCSKISTFAKLKEIS